MRNLLYVLYFLLAFSGCDNIQIGKAKVEDVKVSTVEVKYTPALTEVVDAAKNLSQSDKDYAFKQFSGLSEYINNSNVPDSTKIDKLLDGMISLKRNHLLRLNNLKR